MNKELNGGLDVTSHSLSLQIEDWSAYICFVYCKLSTWGFVAAGQTFKGISIH